MYSRKYICSDENIYICGKASHPLSPSGRGFRGLTPVQPQLLTTHAAVCQSPYSSIIYIYVCIYIQAIQITNNLSSRIPSPVTLL